LVTLVTISLKGETEMAHRPAENAADALAHIRAGGRAFVATYTRCTVLDLKCLTKFEKAGYRLIWDDADGRGIRMASGRKSVYLFKGDLKIELEEGGTT
jgi:hypothetical protein